MGIYHSSSAVFKRNKQGHSILKETEDSVHELYQLTLYKEIYIVHIIYRSIIVGVIDPVIG